MRFFYRLLELLLTISILTLSSLFVRAWAAEPRSPATTANVDKTKKLAKDFGNGGIEGIEVAMQNGSLKEIGHDSEE